MEEVLKIDEKVVPMGTYAYYEEIQRLFYPKLLKFSLDNKLPMTYKREFGNLNISLDEFFIFLKEKGGSEFISSFECRYLYLWDSSYSYITIDFNKKTKDIDVTVFACDNKIIECFNFIKNNFISKSKKSSVFSIVSDKGGLNIQNLGNSSSDLIKDNYNKEVIEDFEYVVDSFNKGNPVGRICILNGEPGTGKTYLVRNFISRTESICLIIPSNLVSSLDTPSFLPLLFKIRTEHEKSIVLIIEDGDICLVPRKSDNMSTIASLLNLSDGILGSLLDIKIIVTTNAKIKDMDQAILRPGRLCKDITVGLLEYDQANAVYHRLMQSKENSLEKRKFYTLAEVYSIFNNKDNPSHVFSKPKTIGFYSPSISKDLTINIIK